MKIMYESDPKLIQRDMSRRVCRYGRDGKRDLLSCRNLPDIPSYVHHSSQLTAIVTVKN